MYLEKLVTSSFPSLNTETFGVINVQPEGKDWFVIAEQSTMTPLFETGNYESAMKRANALAKAGDLAFWARWIGNRDRCEVLYEGALLKRSNDGLSLIPHEIVSESHSFTVPSPVPVNDEINRELNDLASWTQFEATTEFINNKSVIACIDLPDEHPFKKETDYVLVLISKTPNHYVNEPSSIQIELLKPYHPAFGKKSITTVLRAHRSGNIRSWVLGNIDDFQSEGHFGFKYLEQTCPLYVRNHDKATQREHVYIHEGGIVMESLAASRPWMVEKDAHGKALPLRITPMSSIDEPTEDGADKIARFLSSIVLRDQLTSYARQAVITQQLKQGIKREQTWFSRNATLSKDT